MSHRRSEEMNEIVGVQSRRWSRSSIVCAAAIPTSIDEDREILGLPIIFEELLFVSGGLEKVYKKHQLHSHSPDVTDLAAWSQPYRTGAVAGSA